MSPERRDLLVQFSLQVRATLLTAGRLTVKIYFKKKNKQQTLPDTCLNIYTLLAGSSVQREAHARREV